MFIFAIRTPSLAENTQTIRISRTQPGNSLTSTLRSININSLSSAVASTRAETRTVTPNTISRQGLLNSLNLHEGPDEDGDTEIAQSEMVNPGVTGMHPTHTLTQQERDRIARLTNIVDSFGPTTNRNVFNDFMPYKKSIIRDPKKLAKYNALVDKVKNQVGWVNLAGADDQYLYLDLDVPEGFKEYVAHEIVDSFHGRERDIDNVLTRQGGLAILHDNIDFLTNNLGAAGIFARDYNLIGLHKGQTMIGGGISGDGFRVAAHEFGHAVDSAFNDDKNEYELNGILPGMKKIKIGNKSVKQIFKEGRKRLFRKHDDYYKSLSPEQRAADDEKFIDPATGLRNYAFHGGSRFAEFVAVMVETFHERPQALKKADKPLFNALVAYFGYNPSRLHSVA